MIGPERTTIEPHAPQNHSAEPAPLEASSRVSLVDRPNEVALPDTGMLESFHEPVRFPGQTAPETVGKRWAMPEGGLPQGLVTTGAPHLKGLEIQAEKGWYQRQNPQNCYASPAPYPPPAFEPIAQFAEESWDRGHGITFHWDNNCDPRDRMYSVLINTEELKASADWNKLPTSQREAINLAPAWIVDMPKEPSGVNYCRVTGYTDVLDAKERFQHYLEEDAW